MSPDKFLGIWMDHSSAHLIKLEQERVETRVINSAFNHHVKDQTLERSEKEMHHKENHEQLSFYKEIGEAILNYEGVLLFGPTAAKTELFNLLRKDHHFDKIKIDVEPADRMTVNQEQAFVRNYYEKRNKIL